MYTPRELLSNTSPALGTVADLIATARSFLFDWWESKGTHGPESVTSAGFTQRVHPQAQTARQPERRAEKVSVNECGADPGGIGGLLQVLILD